MIPNSDIRETLLKVIHEREPKSPTDGSLQLGSVLNESAKRIGAVYNLELEQALLTQIHDLFRTGFLAWGFNIANPNPPFFHTTERGRALLEVLSRDPGNPSGYLKHLHEVADIGAVARSYLEEGINCYVSGLYKASAVMVGGAAENLILELRDRLVERLTSLGKPVHSNLQAWQVKTVLDSLQTFFSSEKKAFPKQLREEFESYWPAFAQQIRAARNEAGHPVSVFPVTQETVRASLLILPELAKLQDQLSHWVRAELK